MRTQLLLLAGTVFCLGAGPCEISDADIQREIADRNGVEITEAHEAAPIPLRSVQGQWTVGYANTTIIAGQVRPAIRIAYAGPTCEEYCWHQTIREHLDDEVVEDRTVFDSSGPIEARQNATQTDTFWAVDNQAIQTACVAGQASRVFTDSPNFLDSDFTNNSMNDDARLAVWEFETCLTCEPQTRPRAYRGCVRWFYVKVKDGPHGGSRRYLVTRDEVTSPSADFVDAVNRWESTPP